MGGLESQRNTSIGCECYGCGDEYRGSTLWTQTQHTTGVRSVETPYTQLASRAWVRDMVRECAVLRVLVVELALSCEAQAETLPECTENVALV